VPSPVPAAPDRTASQSAVLAIVQLQVGVVFTSKAAVPPTASKDRLGGSSVNAHASPCWLTETDWPATVRVPVRAVVSVAAATVKLNVPGPVTDAPLAAEIHETSERAVQLH